MFEHDSIADIPEDKLVEYLLAVPYWRSTLLGIYGVPSEAMDRQRVLLNSVPGGQFRGDADIILCIPNHPEEAVAYQVKRIKVGMSQLRHSAPSKLEELKLAARQANLLADIGFWKVFLYIITVVDAREQDLLADRSLYNDVKSKVGFAVSNSIGELDKRIGVFDVELVQSTDNLPTTIDIFGGYLRRQATASTQSGQLTEWVNQLFSSKLASAMPE